MPSVSVLALRQEIRLLCLWRQGERISINLFSAPGREEIALFGLTLFLVDN